MLAFHEDQHRYGKCSDYLGNMTCEQLTAILYSWWWRNVTSVAQFWRDPHAANYLAHNVFLPVINNEVAYDERRRTSFLRVKQVHLYASNTGLSPPPALFPSLDVMSLTRH